MSDMASYLERLSTMPGLREWLVTGKWKRIFDQSALQRGTAYASEKFIRDVEARSDFLSQGVIIGGLIHGNAPRPYETDLLFRKVRDAWTVDPDCSCPVAYYCKHSVGLLTYIMGEMSKPRGSHDYHFDIELGTWLREIETAAAVATILPVVPPEKPEKRFLAYCIERPLTWEGKDLHFVLRVGTHLKGGDIKISESRSQADLSRPPKYLANEDFLVVAMFQQRVSKRNSYDDLALTGVGWDELLNAAHATGRLFWGEKIEGERMAKKYLPITSGPPQTVNAVWNVLPSGGAKPELQCEKPGLIVIPTLPSRYLDPATGVLGVAVSDLPAGVLAAWEHGPTVSAKDLAVISERFSTISAAALPVPAKVETVRREPTPPLPHLRVHSRTIGKGREEEDFIAGQISFRYEDSRLLAPLAKGHPQSHAEIRDGGRIFWPRDFEAEQAHIARLKSIGLMSLSGVVSVTLLDTAALHSVVPVEPGFSQQLTWLELLESPEMQALQDSGWTIEIDPKAGLTSHDATDFFPVIESETDHGIDWFRFDITFELQGRQVSLIPIIAQAIRMDLPPADSPELPEFLSVPCENPLDGFIRFPTVRLIELVDQVRHLFHGADGDGPIRIDRIAAAGVADGLAIDSSETTRTLAKLGHSLRNITDLPPAELPAELSAELRPYQLEGYRWLQFLASHGLHGILADDMGLGKTVQTLAHLAAECEKSPGLPSLVIAPTSVVPNWSSETEKFTPHLKVLTLQGKDRAAGFGEIAAADIVLTSYPLLARDFDALAHQKWHVVVLDEAQYIKNPKSISMQNACKLKAAHRLCLSGTPMENHLGELWSLMRFLMPGFLADEKSFNTTIRRPIERDRSGDAQLALNRRVSPLILRRTKDQVATELPEKTEIIHGIDLHKKQTDLYESVRAAMDKRVRDAIASKGLGQSHIIVLDALLKLRQICCHPQLLKSVAAQKVTESAKLDYLTEELLPTLIEEGRRILLFSTFTSMLALIEQHLVKEKIPYLKLTGQTKERASLVKEFQKGETPVFLISLKAGGTGLNLTAADTVIHYDPWWNPAAENQATDRAHRIGQTKPVFVHKLVCRGTIEDRILELQKHKSALVEALLSDETSKLRIDAETLSHLLAPLD
jgi:SNF2-related domain/Helicase conserved C-terminal domain